MESKNINIYEKLFQEINAKMKDFSYEAEKNQVFNIFKVLGIENKEVLACRFMGELLNPQGAHGLREKPLRHFMKSIDTKPYSEAQLLSANVNLEECIDSDDRENPRRVDIAIHIKNDVFPIEVKIRADDQDAQLYDYYRYYKTKSSIKKIYYLTPNGKNPSERSYILEKRQDGLNLTNDVCCLSFEKDIHKWLENVKSDANDNKPMKSIIEQFIEVIEDMCANSERLENIKKAVGLGNNPFEVNDNIQALISLLSEKETLWNEIRKAYLRKSLKLGEDTDYKIIDQNTAPEVYKKHCVLTIQKADEPVAWICVQTYLYMVANKLKENPNPHWSGDEPSWIYISPSGVNKKFNLNAPNPAITNHDEIDISDLLKEIETK